MYRIIWKLWKEVFISDKIYITLKNEYSVNVDSLWCCSKPVWLFFWSIDSYSIQWGPMLLACHWLYLLCHAEETHRFWNDTRANNVKLCFFTLALISNPSMVIHMHLFSILLGSWNIYSIWIFMCNYANQNLRKLKILIKRKLTRICFSTSLYSLDLF